MARHADPERIQQGRRAAPQRLSDYGMSLEDAERWCDAWEARGGRPRVAQGLGLLAVEDCESMTYRHWLRMSSKRDTARGSRSGPGDPEEPIELRADDPVALARRSFETFPVEDPHLAANV